MLELRCAGRDIRLGGSNSEAIPAEAQYAGDAACCSRPRGGQTCTVHDRHALPVGMRFMEPALIEGRKSICDVGPGASVQVDALRNLIVELRWGGAIGVMRPRQAAAPPDEQEKTCDARHYSL